MTEKALATTVSDGLDTDIAEQVLLKGNLKGLTPEQLLSYYTALCGHLGIDPLSKPFDALELNGKLVLYANRNCTDQLRKTNKISLRITDRSFQGNIYIVTALASLPDGRTDESTGAVDIGGLQKEALANALMKTETKAKRRVTLSINGLSFMDDSEVETVAGAVRVDLDVQTGEVAKTPEFPESLPQTVAASTKVDWGTCPIHNVEWIDGKWGPFHGPKVRGQYCSYKRVVGDPSNGPVKPSVEAAPTSAHANGIQPLVDTLGGGDDHLMESQPD